MTPKTRYIAPVAFLALCACSSVSDTLEEVTRATPQADAYSPLAAPPGAQPGSCWGKDVTPAVVETVTEQILMQPAQINSDGSVTSPALYKTETHQQIVRERRELIFETPCRATLTPEFLAILQRALQARGHFHGAITGELDLMTKLAIRSYQKEQGLDSAILSIAAARQLGLVAVPRDQL